MSQFDPWNPGQGGVPPQPGQGAYPGAQPGAGYAQAPQPTVGTFTGTSPMTGTYTGTTPMAGTYAGTPPMAGTYANTTPMAGTYANTPPMAGSYTGTTPMAGAFTGTPPVTGGFAGTPPAAGSFTGTQGPQGPYFTQPTAQTAAGDSPTRTFTTAEPPLGYTAFTGTQQTPPPEQQEEEAPAGFGYVPGSDYQRRSFLQWWHILVMALATAAAAVVIVLALGVNAPAARTDDTDARNYLRGLGLDSSGYAVVRYASIDNAYTGDALIVRDEAVYDQDGVTSVSYTAGEGRSVYYGDDICKVFAASTSTSAMTALQNYRDQIREYQRTLLDSETTIAGERYQRDSALLENVRLVRNIIAGEPGSLVNQESQLTAAINARQAYIRGAYPDDQQLNRAYSDLQAQQQSIDAYTKNYKAIETAIVSFYADGYEYGLNLNNYAEYTAADVRRMINGEKPATDVRNKQIIYRTVKDGRWVVMLLADDREWVPVEGQSLLLYLESSAAGESALEAVVESHSHTGGELLVVLSLERGVSNVLYTRSTRVRVQDASDALAVPESAIYIQDGVEGVVINDHGTESFIPVHVVRRDNTGVYVTSVTKGVLREGMVVRLFH